MVVTAIDIETGGLDPETCQILEIAVVIDDLNDQKPLDQLSFFHTLVRHKIYIGEPYALFLNARIFKMLSDKATPAMDTQEAATALHDFFFQHFKKDKINVLGKNVATFDYRFFMRDPHLRRVADRFFRHRMIDIGALYLTPNDDQIPGMEECMRRAGIEPVVTHEALQDCKDTIRLMRVWRQKANVK